MLQAPQSENRFEIKRIFDSELIKSIVTHPKIYPWISDDGSPLDTEFEPMIDDQIFYLGVYDGDDVFGLFMVHPHNLVLWEIHTCLLPKCWGESYQAAKAVLNWIFTNLKCECLMTYVPCNNKLAAILAKKAGFAKAGVLPKAFKKNGKLYDLNILSYVRTYPCH